MTRASARLADQDIRCPDCGGELLASRFDVVEQHLDDETGLVDETELLVFGLPARYCPIEPRLWMTPEVIQFHGLTNITYFIEEDNAWIERNRDTNGYTNGLVQWQEADPETRRRLSDIRDRRL